MIVLVFFALWLIWLSVEVVIGIRARKTWSRKHIISDSVELFVAAIALIAIMTPFYYYWDKVADRLGMLDVESTALGRLVGVGFIAGFYAAWSWFRISIHIRRRKHRRPSYQGLRATP